MTIDIYDLCIWDDVMQIRPITGPALCSKQRCASLARLPALPQSHLSSAGEALVCLASWTGRQAGRQGRQHQCTRLGFLLTAYCQEAVSVLAVGCFADKRQGEGGTT